MLRPSMRLAASNQHRCVAIASPCDTVLCRVARALRGWRPGCLPNAEDAWYAGAGDGDVLTDAG
jgi:hypothetical protein